MHDLFTWYGMNYTGTQVTHWDFQNRGKSGWTGTSPFVLEVPVHHVTDHANGLLHLHSYNDYLYMHTCKYSGTSLIPTVKGHIEEQIVI